MLANEELEKLEHKYFDILAELLERSIGQVVSQIYSQNSISGAAVGGVTNVIEHAVENIVEAMIASQLHWNICSMPVSADSCFECGDAIIHIDAKTIKIDDGDNTSNKVTVRKSQTTYVTGSPLTISEKTWEPKLNFYENHYMFGEVPNVTYIIKVVYSDSHYVEKIKLISLPHGQLHQIFNDDHILAAGRTEASIRFQEDSITQMQPWRVRTIYERK